MSRVRLSSSGWTKAELTLSPPLSSYNRQAKAKQKLLCEKESARKRPMLTVLIGHGGIKLALAVHCLLLQDNKKNQTRSFPFYTLRFQLSRFSTWTLCVIFDFWGGEKEIIVIQKIKANWGIFIDIYAATVMDSTFQRKELFLSTNRKRHITLVIILFLSFFFFFNTRYSERGIDPSGGPRVHE